MPLKLVFPIRSVEVEKANAFVGTGDPKKLRQNHRFAFIDDKVNTSMTNVNNL